MQAYYSNRNLSLQMKKQKRHTLVVLACLAIVALTLSCENKKHVMNDIRYADSILYHYRDNAQPIIDSLLAAGTINQLAAEYYNICFNLRGTDDYENMLKHAYDIEIKNEKDRIYHIRVAQESVYFYVICRRYDAAMQTFTDVRPMISTDDLEKYPQIVQSYANMQYLVGICNIYKEHYQEGDRLIEVGLDKITECSRDTVNLPIAHSAVFQYPLVALTAFYNQKQYDTSLKWIDRAEQNLNESTLNSKLSAEMKDYMEGHIYNARATIYAIQGKKKESKEYYEKYLKTKTSQSNTSRLNTVDYLLATGQYEEAADVVDGIEQLMVARNMPMTLDNIVGYIVTKYKANLLAGRRDTALAVASRIIFALDSALVWSDRDKSIELATLYETSLKEQKIAEQQIEMNHERYLALAVVLVLITVFFVLYTLSRRRAYAKLAIANARAEESSRMKSDFIQQISHEIRTPLNILSGFAQVITTPGLELDEETSKDINQKITDNTNRITGLVNKMLELSDANSQTVIEKTDNVSVIEIAADAAEASGITSAKHLQFDMELSPEAEKATIQTNRQAATRALTLLLDNARKFTAPAEARPNEALSSHKQRVKLNIKTDEKGVLFTIEDTGIGIPKEEAERVFLEFVQLDEYYEGTGIGLTVARSIARRMGGDVILDASYTNGARFILKLR